MKKLYLCCISFAIMFLMLSCAKKDEVSESGQVSEKITLSFGTQENPGHILYDGYEAFANELEKISDGNMVVEFFPSSQLGDFRAMIEQVNAGELDITTAGYESMAYLVPEVAIMGQAYVIRDYEHLLKVVASPYGEKMNEEFRKQNLELASVWYSGTRQTTANRPLNSINDFKGLKLRVPNVESLIDFAKSTGAIPSPVAFAELYLALQTGQVEAEENPLPTIEASKLYEVQKNVAMTSHFVVSVAFFIGTKTLDKFNDQQRQWFYEAIEVGKKLANDKMFEQEEALIATFKSRGMEFTYPDLQPFRDAMKPYYATLEEKFGAGSIAAVTEIK